MREPIQVPQASLQYNEETDTLLYELEGGLFSPSLVPEQDKSRLALGLLLWIATRPADEWRIWFGRIMKHDHDLTERIKLVMVELGKLLGKKE